MSTLTEISQRNHHRAVRFFWALLIGATTVSLIGNIAHAVLVPATGRHPNRCRRGAANCPSYRGARHRPRRPCRGVRTGLLVGDHRYGTHRSRRIRGELHRPARSDARHRVHVGDCMGLPGHRRYSSCRQHLDALGSRRQTCAPRPQRDYAREYTKSCAAAGCAECKAALHAGSPGSDCMHRQCRPTGRGHCIVTTRPAADPALSASRGGPGRCRPCIRPD
jgi:hypothetical protein